MLADVLAMSLGLKWIDGIKNPNKFKELEKMKKIASLALVAILIIAFSTTAYAGGHGRRGSHHNNRQAATWHNATDHWQGHWSNRCADYDHIWHSTGDIPD